MDLHNLYNTVQLRGFTVPNMFDFKSISMPSLRNYISNKQVKTGERLDTLAIELYDDPMFIWGLIWLNKDLNVWINENYDTIKANVLKNITIDPVKFFKPTLLNLFTYMNMYIDNIKIQVGTLFLGDDTIFEQSRIDLLQANINKWFKYVSTMPTKNNFTQIVYEENIPEMALYKSKFYEWSSEIGMHSAITEFNELPNNYYFLKLINMPTVNGVIKTNWFVGEKPIKITNGINDVLLKLRTVPTHLTTENMLISLSSMEIVKNTTGCVFVSYDINTVLNYVQSIFYHIEYWCTNVVY